MVLPIVAYGHPILRKVANDIDADHPNLPKLLEDMWETMYASNGVGLAAPQINRDIRIFCLCPGNTQSEFHSTAGIHQKKIFLRATTEDLVDFGIAKFLTSSAPTYIHGFINACLAFSNRLTPSRLTLWITRKIYEMRTGI